MASKNGSVEHTWALLTCVPVLSRHGLHAVYKLLRLLRLKPWAMTAFAYVSFASFVWLVCWLLALALLAKSKSGRQVQASAR